MMSNDRHIHKKESLNAKAAIFIDKRDFIDFVNDSEPIHGLVKLDKCLIAHGEEFMVKLVCSFRYGEENDETMGLSFHKEMVMAEHIVGAKKAVFDVDDLRPWQRDVVSKLDVSVCDVFPFEFRFPKLSPMSITIQPKDWKNKNPCGVEYYLECSLFEEPMFNPSSHSIAYPAKYSRVKIMIRKIQYAPQKIPESSPPSTLVRKEILLATGQVELEMKLDRRFYHQSDPVIITAILRNNSSRDICRIGFYVVQCIETSLFSDGSGLKVNVACHDSQQDCPITPGMSYKMTVKLLPSLQEMKDRRGVALTGRMKSDNDVDLASSTLLPENTDKNTLFGITVSYRAKVKLFMSGPLGLGGEVVSEVPIVIMNPRPKKGGYRAASGGVSASSQPSVLFKDMQSNVNDDENIELDLLQHHDVVERERSRSKFSTNKDKAN